MEQEKTEVKKVFFCDQFGNAVEATKEMLEQDWLLKYGDDDKEPEYADKYHCLTMMGYKTLKQYGNLLISQKHYHKGLNLAHGELFGDEYDLAPHYFHNHNVYNMEYNACERAVLKEIEDLVGFPVTVRKLLGATEADIVDCIIFEKVGKA